MTDLVFFAGPVVVTKAHQSIDWRGRDVRIIPIVGEGSSTFAALAESLRDSQGRILPSLVKKYGGGIEPSQVALAAYSAGWGLLDKICQVDADRKAVTAMILADATFSGGNPQTGQGGTPKQGYVRFGKDALDGDRLLVSTTANTTSGDYLTGRQSFELVWNELNRLCYCEPHRVSARQGLPEASGGWWQLGNACFWGDYAKPGSAPGAGSDISHADHNALSAEVMAAFLSPWLAGARGLTLQKIVIALLLAGTAAAVLRQLLSRKVAK